MSTSPKTWELKSPLLKQMRSIMSTARMSDSTIEAYVHWCARFFAYAKCGSIECLDGSMVERFLTHLAVTEKVSASTQNQAFNALLYLFRNLLKKEFGKISAKRAKQSDHLPTWLTQDEIILLLKELDHDWLLLSKLAYGTGIRLMELLRLRVKDFDFGNRMIAIHDGKGGKDRLVPMPKSMVEDLKLRIRDTKLLHERDLMDGYGTVYLPDALAKKYPSAVTSPQWQFAFPSREICRADDGTLRRHHLFPNGYQEQLRKAAARAGINKRVHPHCLRHTFATHFLENGGNLQTLQKILGHKHIETTMIYTHCVDINRAKSPLDFLPK